MIPYVVALDDAIVTVCTHVGDWCSLLFLEFGACQMMSQHVVMNIVIRVRKQYHVQFRLVAV